MFVRLVDTEQILFITRRLTFELLKALSQQIQHAQGDSRLAQAGLQDELLSMKHARAVNHVRETQADRPVFRAAPKRLPACLLTRIDIRDLGTRRLFKFSDVSGEVASVTLDPAQLHWFVARLATHCRSAGWGNPMPVPAWLDQNVDTTPSSQPRARLVH